MSFWAELKRRNVFKVGAAYLIVAWLIAQVASVLAPAFDLPDWAMRFVVLLLVLGFPLALFLAWAYEVTPEGIKRTKHVPLGESIRRMSGQKLNYALTGLLALAVASIALDVYVLRRPQAPDEKAVAEAAPPTTAVAGVTAQPGRLENSVAVLPFDNLTVDTEHQYFAIGIHEEVLNQLAKIRSLKVISRSSVLRYAEDRPPIPEIAEELNVGAVIEGSVRYAGSRILVTVQLIDAATDAHIWSESYPGDLSDLNTIFALQADIAMNVADALRAEFTPAELASIERPITASTEAFEYYLAARVSAQEFTVDGLERALELVEAALALDPMFAAAWTRKSSLHSSLVQRVPVARVAEEQAMAEQAVLRAIELAPDSGEAYAQLGYAASQRRKPIEAEIAYRRAEELGFANLGGTAYGILLLSAGNFTKSRRIHEFARDLDPLNGVVRGFLLSSLGLAGDAGMAETEHARARALYGEWPFGDQFLLWQRLGTGNVAGAVELASPDPIDAAVVPKLGSPDDALADLRRLRADAANANQVALTSIAMWAAYFGDAGLALEVMQQLVASNTQNVFLFWYPQMRNVRSLSGFRDVMREAGFVDYWDEFGWPQACRRTTGDDFECV